MQLPPWLMLAWKMLDESLAGLSRRLQRVVQMLRLARVLLILGTAVIFLSGVLAVLAALGYVSLDVFLYSYALATLVLIVPTAMLAAMVSLPLKARSIIRLIDKGYPENARELAIRMVARKMHDQSIETEELLWDTAVNEGRKVLRKMQRTEQPGPGTDGAGGADGGSHADGPAGAPPRV